MFKFASATLSMFVFVSCASTVLDEEASYFVELIVNVEAPEVDAHISDETSIVARSQVADESNRSIGLICQNELGVLRGFRLFGGGQMEEVDAVQQGFGFSNPGVVSSCGAPIAYHASLTAAATTGCPPESEPAVSGQPIIAETTTEISSSQQNCMNNGQTAVSAMIGMGAPWPDPVRVNIPESDADSLE
jgi:hypothetical protein